MASGTYNLSLEHPSSSVSFQGKLEWTSTSNGSVANTSLVEVKLYARKQGSSSATSGTFKGYITIDGTKTTFSQSKSVQNSWVLISTSSKTVSHNADGTKSITIAGAVGKVSGTTLANIESSGSSSITLDTIPRYATINNISLTNDESNIYIDINTPAYTSYSSLQYTISLDNSTPIDSWRTYTLSGTGVGLVSTYLELNATEKNAIYNAFTTTNNATIYIMVKSTLNGTSSTAKQSATLQIINANPIYDDSKVSYQDTVADVISITGNNQILVGGNSIPQITWTAPTMQKGATFSSISFSFVDGSSEIGQTFNTTTGNFTLTDTLWGRTDTFSFWVIVEDSRGNETSFLKTISVIGYYEPIIEMTASRQNNYEDSTTFTANITIAPVDSLNSIQTLQYRTQRIDLGTWSGWTNYTNNTPTTITLDKNYRWGIQVEITDRFNSTKRQAVIIEKGVFPLFIDTDLNSVGVNTFPVNSQSFEVGGNTYLADTNITGNVLIDGHLTMDGNIYDYNQSICTATLSSDKTLTSASSTYVALTSEATIGDKLTVSNGTINITGVCEYVLISGKIQFNTLNNSTGLRYIQIFKNSTNIISTRTYVYSGNTGTFITIPPQLVKVSYGDKISLYVQGLTNDVVRSTAVWSYLTVEALYYKSQ